MTEAADAGLDPVAPSPSLMRSVFGHGATYAVAGIVGQGTAVLLFPFFAHVFSPHDYGIIDLVAMALTLVNLTVALEVSQALNRYLPETDDPDERQAFASTALWFTVATYSVALAAAFVALRPVTDALLGGGARTALMAVGLVAIWCNGMLHLTQNMLQAGVRPRASAAVSVVVAIVVAATSAVLVLGFKTGVIGALIGQLAGYAVGLVLAFIFARDLCRFRFDRARLRLMLAYSVPLIPASTGAFLNGYADRIAIRYRLTVADVGVYGVGYRFSIIVLLTLLGFQSALLPLVFSRHQHAQTRIELAQIFRIFVAIALSVFVLISVYADEMLRVLTRPAYYGASAVIPILAAASFLAGMYVFAPGLNIAMRTGTYSLVVGVSAVLNTALAFGLVGTMGIKGPAVAFLVGSGLSFTLLMLMSQRAYPVPHEWRKLLPVTAVVSAVVLLVRHFLGGSPDLRGELLKLAATAVALGVTALLLRPEELLRVVRAPQRSVEALRSVRRTARSRRRARRA